jgi:radical SAM-linked protein
VAPTSPHETPPVVQRLRVRYARRGRLRFTSHRDVARALERALRRSGVPVAFSAGFSPHPKISYVGAAPTGTASEAEYLELGLAEPADPEDVRRRLDAAWPDGLDVVEVVVAGPGSLPDRITGSHWQIRLPGLTAAVAEPAVAAFLAAPSAPVERVVKDGRRTVDARAAVVSLRVTAADCAILDVVVRHLTPAVRPDDVLTALRAIADLVPPSPPQVTRLAQGLLAEDGRIADPLEPDRTADPGAAGAAPEPTFGART